MQVVVFRLGDEQFAVETSKVQNINDIMEITKVPKSPNYIKGLINLRGTIISLLDINMLLDITSSNDTQSNIIILQMQEELVGITVDEVDEVIDVEEDMIEKVDTAKKTNCIRGVINLTDRIVTLIDIDKLVQIS
ncbi:MAG: chemotaxis protein CheW [Bacillota bacterium]|nr:chemotaxis protein CheW [Bacillota bacterium]